MLESRRQCKRHAQSAGSDQPMTNFPSSIQLTPVHHHRSHEITEHHQIWYWASERYSSQSFTFIDQQIEQSIHSSLTVFSDMIHQHSYL